MIDAAEPAPPPPEELKMEFHKPKPVHSFRELFTEIGVIVIGVAIALAAEQGVEWVHWRSEVAQARETIATEMANNIRYSIQRMRIGVCLASRLEEVDRILVDAGRTGILPSLGEIGGEPLVPWPSSAWESVVASQTATHFPRQELALISLNYARVQRVENWTRQELEEWFILRRMSGPSRRYDPALGAEWQKALALAMAHLRAITGTAGTITREVQSLNLPFTAEEQRSMAEAKTAPLNEAVCERLSTEPSTDGNRISPQPFRDAEAAVKSLPYGRQP